MGSWNGDSLFLIISQRSNPMNLSWRGLLFFFFKLQRVRKIQRSHPQRTSTFYRRTTRSSTVLVLACPLPGDSIPPKWLLYSPTRVGQGPPRERAGLSPCWVFHHGPESLSGASANRQFSSSLARAQGKAAHSFCAICFTFPHGVGACKRLLSTKLFLIKSPSSGVMINTN